MKTPCSFSEPLCLFVHRGLHFDIYKCEALSGKQFFIQECSQHWCILLFKEEWKTLHCFYFLFFNSTRNSYKWHKYHWNSIWFNHIHTYVNFSQPSLVLNYLKVIVSNRVSQYLCSFMVCIKMQTCIVYIENRALLTHTAQVQLSQLNPVWLPFTNHWRCSLSTIQPARL